MKNAIATANFIPLARGATLRTAPLRTGCGLEFDFPPCVRLFFSRFPPTAAPLRRRRAVSLQRLVYSRPDFSPRFRSDLTSAAVWRRRSGGGGGLANYTKLFFCIIRLGRGVVQKITRDKKPHANFFEGNILEQVCGIIYLNNKIWRLSQ